MTSTTAISTTSRGWRYRRSRTSPAGSGTGCTMSCPVSTGFSCAAARAAKAAPSATGRPDPNRRSGYSEPSEQLQHARGGAVGEEVALHATLVGKKIDRQTPISQQCRQDRVGSLLVEHALGVDHPVSILGAAEDGHRVIYAESVFDEKGADAILATLLTDRRLSVDFFADERRMERDLLADGAAARVLQLFGRLGVP